MSTTLSTGSRDYLLLPYLRRSIHVCYKHGANIWSHIFMLRATYPNDGTSHSSVSQGIGAQKGGLGSLNAEMSIVTIAISWSIRRVRSALLQHSQQIHRLHLTPHAYLA